MVHEVYGEDGHLEHELEVVDVDATVLPDALVVQVVQVHRVADDHVQRLQTQDQTLTDATKTSGTAYSQNVFGPSLYYSSWTLPDSVTQRPIN